MYLNLASINIHKVKKKHQVCRRRITFTVSRKGRRRQHGEEGTKEITSCCQTCYCCLLAYSCTKLGPRERVEASLWMRILGKPILIVCVCMCRSDASMARSGPRWFIFFLSIFLSQICVFFNLMHS